MGTYAREMATKCLSVVEGKVPRYPPDTFNEAEKVIAAVIERCAQEVEKGCPTTNAAGTPCAACSFAATRIRALSSAPTTTTTKKGPA